VSTFRANICLIAAAGVALVLLAPASASAQEDGLRLGMRRTFGYAWGSDIQGSFLLVASGPADVDRVAFYIDQDLLETVTAPPFEARLHTGDYPLGVHQLQAVGARSDGSTLLSNVIRVEFVTAEAGWQFAAGLLTPVLLVVGLALALSIGMTAISSRRYRPGHYGGSGGAVCPRCHLPLARHFLAPNIGLKKLERCPHCGRWSLVSRASAEDLMAAEARLQGETPTDLSPEATAEALRRQVEDSRFTE
jgi:hypothetical protein